MPPQPDPSGTCGTPGLPQEGARTPVCTHCHSPLCSNGIFLDKLGWSAPQPHISSCFPADRQQVLSGLPPPGLEPISWDFDLWGIYPESYFSYTLFRSLPPFLRSTGRWRAEYKASRLYSLSIFSWGNGFAAGEGADRGAAGAGGLETPGRNPRSMTWGKLWRLCCSAFLWLIRGFTVFYYFCQVGKGSRGCCGFPVLQR